MSVQAALDQLATYRTQNTRASQDIFEKGALVLEKHVVHKMGDECWGFLEQLALAAIDVGRLDVADECLRTLNAKFPGSPRVDCLTGIRMEASEAPDIALKYYAELLEADPTHAAVWKRRISIFRRTGKIDKAVHELSQYLDTFYTDVEGWLELADIYATSNQYEYSLQSLEHVLLLAPQNPFYVLQAAETAYTAGDLALAIKMFLMVVDMTDGDDSESLVESTPLGITVRAWYGVKLCTRRMAQDARLATSSRSNTPPPKNVKMLDELATERLRVAYSSSGKKGEIAKGREEVFAWVAAH
ncbi:TPR-like protein [Boletus edulis]|uniref:ER membrane protein complex subunit 2 n=1 Tax=Boletus edulis BED1 TaxID=1328754 RepID=A0AAD4C971_BOLED|nr:TPR-like protein [Boletus edulis]KAF8452690.1 TPR-like protein [Boletus edulis BED1]